MIRYFNKQDIDTIYKLGNKLDPNFQKTNNLEEILNNSYTKILVFESEGLIKGFLMYTDLGETVDICDIYVLEEYRRSKIASCLIDYMFDELSPSIKLLTLEVRKDNLSAINLYKKFGFEVISIRKKYYKDTDAYLMGRRIR